MEIMKEAVEKSSVVLVCLSQKYKDSPSCRTGEKTVHTLQGMIFSFILLQYHFNRDDPVRISASLLYRGRV